jgi:hypothetical protein
MPRGVKRLAYNTTILLLWITPWVLPIFCFRLIERWPLVMIPSLIGLWLAMLALAGWFMERIDPSVGIGGGNDTAGGTAPTDSDHPSRLDSPLLLLVIPAAIAAVCLVAWFLRKL